MSTFQKGQRVQVRTVDTVLEGVVTDDGCLSDGTELCVMQVHLDGWERPQVYPRRQVYPLTPGSESRILADAVDALYGIKRAAADVHKRLLEDQPF